jgi:glucose-6-phosphate isomerase
MTESIQVFDPLPTAGMPLQSDFIERFWRKDPSLWSGGNESEVASMLGWIDVLEKVESHFEEIANFRSDVLESGFTRVVLCGMGGSSLAPLVLSRVFGELPGGLPLHVLDSTHPKAIEEVLAGGLESTVFIVASKSGSTAEPTAFDRFFFDHVGNPSAFVAITDPGSPFSKSAAARNYRKIFLNYADIGGRFSALSLFGLVPAALLGIDIERFVAEAKRAMADMTAGHSDAFELGEALGRYALEGRNKLTIHTSEGLSTFGLWLEQLVAESTGKHGKGILPIAGEAVAPVSKYGDDRFFAGFNVAAEKNPSFAINATDPYFLAAEFLRWEVATATAGAVLGINPFDQPNVQESKEVTKRILAQVEATGQLPDAPHEQPASALDLHGFLSNVEPGDFIAIQAFLPETSETTHLLSQLQANLMFKFGVPVTMGFGPRFLHSTGQFHKGGPNTGHFVQILDSPTDALAIPGQRATWSQYVVAQARGDYEALVEKDRRVISFNLGQDVLGGLKELNS